MRQAQRLLLLAAVLLARSAPAQEQRPDSVAPRPDSTAAADRTRTGPEVETQGLAAIATVRRDPLAPALPAPERFTAGSRTIAAGEMVAGPVAVVGGDLDVRGTITGDAFAVGGDIIVHQGARIEGNAFAGRGKVRLEGGTITGEIRSLSGEVGPVAAAAEESRPEASTRAALGLAFGWLVILILIGIGVLVFAGSYLDGVVETLEASFWRSLVAGLAAQLGFIPALVLVVIALALTIIGILLIPFAVVAFTLGAIGLVTLGFLGVARLTGQSLASSRTRRLSARGAALRSIFVGISAYMLLWVIAAALTWAPIVSIGIKGIALAVTWVAATAGLGATVLSRAGTRRLEPDPAEPPEPASMAWQTPTPITGVVAARRPTATSGKR